MTPERIKGEPTANRLAIEALSHENHIVKNALRLQQFEQIGYVEALEIAVLQLAAVNAARPVRPAPAPAWASVDYVEAASDLEVLRELAGDSIAPSDPHSYTTARQSVWKAEAIRRGLLKAVS